MRGHCILSHGFESGPDATKVTALADVAERLGFASEAHFSRAFRAAFGHTPSDVRAMAEAARATGMAPPTPSTTASVEYADWLLSLHV